MQVCLLPLFAVVPLFVAGMAGVAAIL